MPLHCTILKVLANAPRISFFPFFSKVLRWCRTTFRSHKISLFPGNTFCFVRKSFRHDIPYISAECGFRRNMSTCYSHKFQESLHKISTWQPSQTSDVPNPEKKKFHQPTCRHFIPEKWTCFWFSFQG